MMNDPRSPGQSSSGRVMYGMSMGFGSRSERAGQQDRARKQVAAGSGVQAGDRFRGGSEGGIAGCRVPALAGLDELNLMRVQAAHGGHGEVTAWRAGRARLGCRLGVRV